MTALLWLPILLPPIAAAVLATRPRASWSSRAPLAVATLALVIGVALVADTREHGPVRVLGGLLRADTMSGYLLAVIGAVAVTALWGGLPVRGAPDEPDGRYAALLVMFLGAMSLAVLTDNLGVLWVAVEATTITTAFLVGHKPGRGPLEAAWKYVILGSVGVAIAFLGIVLLYAASRAAGHPTLSWTTLASGTVHLDPRLTRVAVGLTALGFATKAGLAPMHSWLPDAHSQAPAPVSGLMSGVLLSVAFGAILRVQMISNAVLGPFFMRALLATCGLLSLAFAAALMIVQQDFKRLLAYSSIEHMGLLALGAAVGGQLATAAVLLHVLGHGLVKAAMFVTAGRILEAEGSSRIGDITGLLNRRPELARPFLAGTAALLGFPPFVLFFTEAAIFVAGWQRGMGWVMAIALAPLVVVFTAFARHALAMTVGIAAPVSGASHPLEVRRAPVLLALVVAAALVAVPQPVSGMLTAAVHALTGAR